MIKAGLAHLWFVTVHPFQNGDSRIARAVGDMALARAAKSTQRLYSLSSQIRLAYKDYFKHVESTHKGSLEVTASLARHVAARCDATTRLGNWYATALEAANRPSGQ